MSDERAFLKAIRANPGDRTTKLVYADWLEEHDDPQPRSADCAGSTIGVGRGAERAELIRIEEEIRTTPIHSDRYWELKPRRRALLKSTPKPWLKQMGYGRTDYQPVFADIPAGWKERWRLIREFTERWYQIPMNDVGGPLKPLVRKRGQTGDQNALQTVDDTLNNPKVSASLPPSLREWLFFIRDMQVSLKGFGDGSGDWHYLSVGEGIGFLQLDGCRESCFVRDEQRREPDPPVWWETQTGLNHGRDSWRLVAPHVTTLALHYLLMQHEPEFGEQPEEQRMTKKLARQLARFFPVHGHFDETQLFERENVIALWAPESLFACSPCLHVKVRPPANRDEIVNQLFQ